MRIALLGVDREVQELPAVCEEASAKVGLLIEGSGNSGVLS